MDLIARIRDHLQIGGNKKVALLDLLSLSDSILEGLALQLYGIQTYMDQDLAAAVGGQSNGMACIHQIGNSAVSGSDHSAIRRKNGNALSQSAGREYGIRNLIDIQDLAGHGRCQLDLLYQGLCALFFLFLSRGFFAHAFGILVKDGGQEEGKADGSSRCNNTEDHALHGIFTADELDQGQDGGRTAHGIALDAEDTADQTGYAGAGDGTDHGLAVAEVDTVHGRLGDACNDGGNTAGDAFGLGLHILSLDSYAQGSAALCDVGAEHGHENDDVKAQGSQVVHAQRDQRIVHAGHDDERHDGGQDADGEPGHGIVHGREYAAHQITKDVADGSQDAEGNGGADQEEQHGLKESLEHVGRYLIGKVFRPAHDRGHEKDRQDRRCIGCGNDRNKTEDIGAGHAQEGSHGSSFHGAAQEIDDVRIAEHGADDHEHRHRVVGLLGDLNGQEDGQEVEEAVGHAEEEGVGGRGAAHEAEGGQKGQKHLDHTCSKHRRQERCHAACDKSHESL